MTLPTTNFSETQGYSGNYSREGRTLTRTIRAKYSDLDAIISTLFFSDLDPTTTFDFPNTDLPLRDMSWAPFDTDIEVKAATDPSNPTGTEEYDTAAVCSSGVLITLNYGTNKTKRDPKSDDQSSDDEFDKAGEFTFDIEGATKVLQIPSMGGRVIEWENSNGAGSKKMPPNMGLNKVIPHLTLRIGWRFVEFPNWDEITKVLGAVNDDTFIFWAAEQVLFVSFDAARDTDPLNGKDVWNLGFHYEIRRFPFVDSTGATAYGGWNHFFRPDAEKDVDDAWQKTDPLMYAQADLYTAYATDVLNDLVNAFGAQVPATRYD